MILALFLSLCAAPPAAPQNAGPQARVEVLEGRALLAGRGAIARLDEGAPARWIAGRAHLELAAGSRARVTWSGRASLLLEGRTVLEWTAVEGADSVLGWDFAEIGGAHLELRRGPVDVHLAGGWSARFQSGACFLGGLPGGSVELVHSAGLPIDLWPPAREGRPSVPFTLLAGGQLRLLGGTLRPLAASGASHRLRETHQRLGAERVSRAPDFPAWQSFSWPWVGGSASAIEAATGAALRLPGAPDLPDGPALPEESAQPAQAALPEQLPGQPAATAPSEAPAVPAAAATTPTHPVAPATPGATAAPSHPARPVSVPAPDIRSTGVLILTPYGPRWIDKSLPVAAGARSQPR